MPCLFAHRVGIDRGRGELRMAQPALHEIEGNPFFDTGHAKTMPQPFGARLGTGDAGACHDLDDAGVGRFQGVSHLLHEAFLGMNSAWLLAER